MSFEEVSALIGKPVQIEVVRECAGPSTIEGNLYTVDPVTNDIVIITFKPERSEANKFFWFPQDGVKRITRLEKATETTREESAELNLWMNQLFHNRPEVNEGDSKKRKVCLIKWLRSNRIEVSETENHLMIFGTVRVESPYTAEDCYCDNEIVLNRVRKMVAACPSE